MKTNKLKKFISAAFAFCAAALYAELPDPILWWKMDEIKNGKVLDVSGNGRDLTLGAGCSLTNDSVSGSAVYFNGKVNEAYGTFSVPALTSRTISFWIRRDKTIRDISPTVVPFVYFNVNTFWLHYDSGSDSTSVTSYHGGDGTSQIHPSFREQGIANDCWHHFALVVEKTGDTATGFMFTYRMYVDGRLCREVLDVEAVSEKKVTAYLGNRSVLDRPIHAIFDDFRIYDIPLTSATILDLYRTRRTEPRLIAHWDFDEKVGGKYLETTGYAESLTPKGYMESTNGVSLGRSALNVDGSDNSGGSAKNLYPHPCWDSTAMVWLRIDPEMAHPKYEGNAAPRAFRLPNEQVFCYSYSATANNRTVNFYQNYNSSLVSLNNYLPGYGAWVHFAVTRHVTFDDATGKYVHEDVVYRNGERFESLAPLTNDTALVISPNGKPNSYYYLGQHGDNRRAFTGEIDDFRVYDGILSDEAIRAHYRDSAAVDAGADFAVGSTQAELRGRVLNQAQKVGVRKGYAGEIIWTQTSGPVDAEIANPFAPVTEVELKTEGTYVFRLSSRVAPDCVTWDEVTVTREASASRTAPSVSIAAATTADTSPESLSLAATVIDPQSAPVRLKWTRVSGPGTVAFADPFAEKTAATFSVPGIYTVRCVAENGDAVGSAEATVTVSAASSVPPASLSIGLMNKWSFDGVTPWKDDVTGTVGSFKPDVLTCIQCDGASGNGVVPVTADRTQECYFDTGCTLPQAMAENECCTNQWLTLSVWVYVDPNAAVSWRKETSIFELYQSIGLRYNCQLATPTLVMYSQANGGSAYSTAYVPPYSLKGRWTHLAAVYDRKSAPASNVWSFYVDGVEITSTDPHFGPGRHKMNFKMLLGGKDHSAERNTANGWFTDDGTSSGNLLSRTFPGKIDEVRVYFRKLSETEIHYLANHPNVDETTGPLMDGFPTKQSIVRKGMCTLSPDVVSGVGNTPVYGWKVLSGAADGLEVVATASGCEIRGVKTGLYTVALSVSDGERTVWSSPVTLEVLKRGVLVIVR